MAAAVSSKPASAKVTLKVAPEKLRAILHQEDKLQSPLPDLKPEREASMAPSNTASLKAVTVDTTMPTMNGDATITDSAPETPGQPGTPSMAPPTKKGVKRAAPGVNGEPRDRKKPGPKKKKLDDGEMKSDRNHKLGPKANQGAINAGLRALDRSGKPCRKWVKGSFTIKSFTGVTWDISRWAAPAQAKPETDGAADVAACDKAARESEVKTTSKVSKTKTKPAEVGSKDASASATPTPTDVAASPTAVAPAATALGEKKAGNEAKTEEAQDVDMQDASSSSVPSLATNSPLPPAIAAA
ncbi:INO80 complex subunit 4 [Ceratocystis fimbriata CBS 114723]|uniref:INO80 complex subunit 4 n=1 Tax=Ceratocystis fimbriata CBS 114723 TaxID=1035309 RepID=A0A2C5WXE9_9PEZI|nr:INO80 complex subunit 4 [Ceratocystis fimbriata CBS 114723]